MEIVILNGAPAPGGLDGYLDELSRALEARGDRVVQLRLRELEQHHCVGCFGCWVRTPGECSFRKDAGGSICRSVINSELTLLASPILMGHVSALLRRANERLLPLLLPYARLVAGESRHVPRYPRSPRLALLLEQGADADAEDVAIIERCYEMTARNFASALACTHTTRIPAEEVADALAAA